MAISITKGQYARLHTNLPAPHFVFLNGPPHSGKDEAARFLRYMFEPTNVFEFKRPLIGVLAGALYMHVDDLIDNPILYKDIKDNPQEELGGMTGREFMIGVSEKVYKGQSVYGKQVFGQLVLQEWQKFWDSNKSLAICPDSGFLAEAVPIIECYGADKCLLIHVHRQGCNFDNDSRSYWLYDNTLTTVELQNDGDLFAWQAKVGHTVHSWFNSLDNANNLG